MRKVLAGCLCATAAAAPAVAFAATDDDSDSNVAVVEQSAAALTMKHDSRFRVAGARTRARAEVAEDRRERRRAIARKRARRLAKQARVAAPTGAGGTATPAHLQSIAACESGGNPAAVGGGGAYRGKYQFDYSTWASVGGSGDPAAAPEAEQDQRAAMLYARSGSSPWPNCG